MSNTTTIMPLMEVLRAFPRAARTPAMRRAFRRQLAIEHRSDVIKQVGIWMRGKVETFAGRATAGVRPRAVWMQFNWSPAVRQDRFRYSLYFSVTEPFMVSLWISTLDDPDARPPSREWHLVGDHIALADFQTGADLMEAVLALLDDPSLDTMYRWLDGEDREVV